MVGPIERCRSACVAQQQVACGFQPHRAPLLKAMDGTLSLKTFASRWSYLELKDSSELAAFQRVVNRLESLDVGETAAETFRWRARQIPMFLCVTRLCL